MRYLHTIFIILFFVLSVFFSFGVKETFADRYITQVNENSNTKKIEKLQEVFKGLGLYSGKIDGNFSSIREALIDYQVENGIVPDREHDEAGYFGNKTIKSLKQKFGKDFENLQKEYLTLEAPALNQEGTFIVTAYYTPVVGQEKYSTGSYEAEKKLNGGGNTASGKKPSAGTIAAPRNYAFGTKIYLEGFGVGVVEDRGGAIVNSGDNGHLHDRLDIWMGYGDEARERTRAWGVRTIKGKILDNSSEVKVFFEENEKFENISDEKNEKSSSLNYNNEIEKYKNIYISLENPKSEDVKKIQELLKKVKLYNGEIDGDFEKIREILVNFQIENGIINSKNSSEAGYFGKKTYEAFLKNFGKNFELVGNYKQSKIETLSFEEKQKILKVRDLILQKANNNSNSEKYLENIKNSIIKLSDSLENNKKQELLKYLLENL